VKFALSSFQTWGHCAAPFSKSNCSSETNLTDLKTGEIGPGRFSKALGEALRNLSSNRREEFKLAGFKTFQQIQKNFRGKWPNFNSI
jgi:hypothetical protein